MGATFTFWVHNPNSFPVILDFAINNSQFELETFDSLLDANSFKKLTLIFHPYKPVDDTEVPRSISYAGLVTVSTNVEAVGLIALDVFGILVDVCTH